MKSVIFGLSYLMVTSAPLMAQEEHAGHFGAGSTFGQVHFVTSCSPAAQEQFDRAVALLHSFFYPETEKAFRAVVGEDSQCAMGYWGLAISQRPNPLTAPFPPALLKLGWEAIEKARAARPATPRERDWIEALAVFFQGYDTVDQRTRSARYESAMARLHERYPDDTEASVFYALALLEAVDLTDRTYARQLRAAKLLESLQGAQPDHPGIPHYLIHSYDYAPIAAQGLPSARRYAALAPSAPHALHMPSHTFSTLGMWREAIASNLAADAANRAYATSTSPAAAANPASIVGRYHALDFLVNAYLQLGQDKLAKAIVDELGSVQALPSGASITAHTGLAAIFVRYAFDRSAWKEAASLAPRPSPFKQAEAIIWFGRALGAARSGDTIGARQALAQIVIRQRQLAAAGDPYWADQVGIQETAASAWIALAGNDKNEAIALMVSAANREDESEKSVAMENRLSPMRELLGELFLQVGRPKDALAEFERSLEAVPNRRRSLIGAAEAAEKSGNRRLGEAYRMRWMAQSTAAL
ncbi:MAG TPA: hypothetical protein VN645_13765 [Steroidobacteraceae bacterium]|nr:hypothetical protein [Steroidobacteraceae bacterium]